MIPGVWAAGTVAVDGGLTGLDPGVPGGRVPVAVAVSVDRAVVEVGLGHRVGAGARLDWRLGASGLAAVVAGQIGPVVRAPAGAVPTSVTVTLVRATLPVLVTRKL